MGTQITISSVNFNGQIATITFYPATGGTINLGSHLLPYTLDLDYYYGSYDLFFSAFSNTCSFDILAITPTPTITPTITPTLTPTVTPTQTNTPTPTEITNHLQSEASENILTESNDFIDIDI